MELVERKAYLFVAALPAMACALFFLRLSRSLSHCILSSLALALALVLVLALAYGLLCSPPLS